MEKIFFLCFLFVQLIWLNKIISCCISNKRFSVDNEILWLLFCMEERFFSCCEEREKEKDESDTDSHHFWSRNVDSITTCSVQYWCIGKFRWFVQLMKRISMEILLAKEHLWISSNFSIVSFQSFAWHLLERCSEIFIFSSCWKSSSINRRFLYNYSSDIRSFDIYSLHYSQCLAISRRNSHRSLLVSSSPTPLSSHWNLLHRLHTKRIRIQMVTNPFRWSIIDLHINFRFCPSAFTYLIAVVPCIWLIELHHCCHMRSSSSMNQTRTTMYAPRLLATVTYPTTHVPNLDQDLSDSHENLTRIFFKGKRAVSTRRTTTITTTKKLDRSLDDLLKTSHEIMTKVILQICLSIRLGFLLVTH